MPAKKKTATTKETEPGKAAAAAPATPKSGTKAKSSVKEAKAVATKPTAAATHKAPATKKAQPKARAAAAAVGTAPLSETPAVVAPFDASLYREEIEREAYFLWINRGGAKESPQQDWFEAVEIVRRRYSR